MTSVPEALLHPLTIGNVKLPNNLVLSPMAGYSDLPFRILCRRHGAGLVCSEMVAASSIERGISDHLRRMKTVEEERPTSVQLFGTDRDEVAGAAREAEDACDILGFNMGCPAPQIKRQGCGAALLDRPEVAADLVRSIKGASRKPLLVKIRAGNRGRIDVVALARRLEDAGADALIFHARTADQGYSGRSDWQLIRDLKQQTSLPVIGNGDIVDGPSAENALRLSGADGVALGRAALGDPRIFTRIAAHLAGGDAIPLPTPTQRAADFLQYFGLALEADIDLPQIIHQAQRFVKGIEGNARIRERLQAPGRDLERVKSEFLALAASP